MMSKNLLNSAEEQLKYENNKLKNQKEGLILENEKLEAKLDRTKKINEYWENKDRGFRRKDIKNDEVIRRYNNGESAYKIAKDMNIGQMTIISRLKKANIYKGKEHVKGV